MTVVQRKHYTDVTSITERSQPSWFAAHQRNVSQTTKWRKL